MRVTRKLAAALQSALCVREISNWLGVDIGFTLACAHGITIASVDLGNACRKRRRGSAGDLVDCAADQITVGINMLPGSAPNLILPFPHVPGAITRQCSS